MASLLARAHIEGEARLRRIIADAVERIWRALPGHDRANVDQWLSQVLPLILAGQAQSVALTNAYLARAMERQPLALDPTRLIGAGARNGTPPADVYERPFVTMWSSLGKGNEWQDAFDAGLARARGSAAIDMQLSMRAAAAAVNEADPEMFGFQRVPDAGACEFCLAVEGAYVKDGGAMPLHNNCGCSLEPLTSPHPRAVLLPDGTRIREHQGGPLISSPPPSSVAIHEHGELGPVLTDPSDHFTTMAEALG